ncbi:hypothetical protein BDP27DRAFT_34275 [Rhodocollybia butyracea]|uniref:Uncharacterized protein n=1 Tax=Rhodocollybia butyracea TaxID=206335 RepID=A0A9P5Q668_9AGAR|nr:hypothetical protein BDP27DRAFT_34275 [Rhodocollybia butyracea]
MQLGFSHIKIQSAFTPFYLSTSFYLSTFLHPRPPHLTMSSPSSSNSTGAIVAGAIAGSLILVGSICILFFIYRFKRKRKTRITPHQANSFQRPDNLRSRPTYSAIASVPGSSQRQANPSHHTIPNINVPESSHQANPSHHIIPSQAGPQPGLERPGQQTSTERESENIQSQMTQLQHANTELRDEVARVLGHVRRLEVQIELEALEREAQDTAPPPTYVSG